MKTKLYSVNELIGLYGLNDPQVRLLLFNPVYSMDENKSKICFSRKSPKEINQFILSLSGSDTLMLSKSEIGQ